jgi:hypothetical protein
LLLPLGVLGVLAVQFWEVYMPDAFIKIRVGEKRPIYGQVTADSGTLTIQASPGPTLTLYDSNGAAVTGLNNIAATGYDAGALAAPRAWYNLDTTTPASLAAGFYTMVFKFTANGSDGLTRVYEPSVEIAVGDVKS